VVLLNQSGDHQENDLAKFGYIPDMKVVFKNSNKQNFSMFLATC
jgi:hypothetical protein